MNKMARIGAILLITCVAFAAILFAGAICLRQFTFDQNQSLDEWSKLVFNGEVHYTLMKTADEGFVQAMSDKASSAIYYRIGFRLKDYPNLSWKWKVTKFPDLSNAVTLKERDDYAARVYVIFPFLSFSSSQFIEYVWSDTMPEETILDSPFGPNIKMIVVRNGKTPIDEWVAETRNVYNDYIMAFGSVPRRGAGAIAIMCDADGSKSQAESMFDDIMIENAKESKGA